MDPEDKQTPDNQSQGYQPTIGRKLVMLALCVVGLIVVWTVYLLNR